MGLWRIRNFLEDSAGDRLPGKQAAGSGKGGAFEPEREAVSAGSAGNLRFPPPLLAPAGKGTLPPLPEQRKNSAIR